MWLPATSKFFVIRGTRGGKTTPGRPSSRCRLCNAWSSVKSPGSSHGYVSTRTVLPMFQEAVNRVGMKELIRRSGVSQTVIRNVIHLRTAHVQKAKARAVVLELISMRLRDEHSIHPSAAWWISRRGVSKVCEGCGGHVDNFTEGCSSCAMRKRQRERRESSEYVASEKVKRRQRIERVKNSS